MEEEERSSTEELGKKRFHDNVVLIRTLKTAIGNRNIINTNLILSLRFDFRIFQTTSHSGL